MTTRKKPETITSAETDPSSHFEVRSPLANVSLTSSPEVEPEVEVEQEPEKVVEPILTTAEPTPKTIETNAADNLAPKLYQAYGDAAEWGLGLKPWNGLATNFKTYWTAVAAYVLANYIEMD